MPERRQSFASACARNKFRRGKRSNRANKNNMEKKYTYIYIENVKLKPNDAMKRRQKFLVCTWVGEDPVKRLGELKIAFEKEGRVTQDTKFRICAE